MKENTKEIGSYLIHILASVLKNEKPKEKPEEITFTELFRFAKFHSVAAMAYYGVEKLDVKPEDELNQAWGKIRNLNMAKSFTQLSERDAVLDTLTGKGIAVLPLKGCLLKEMYPQSDYREMADLDILIDVSKAGQARSGMEELGYETKYFNQSNHDVYEKAPYMGIELHRYMIPEQYETHNYYENVWTRAVADEKRPGIYHFSWDDFYIYMLAHFAKHYFSCGSGIRSLIDIYVFLQMHSQELHQEYLKQELDKINLWQFKQDAEKLSGVWFAGDQEEEQILQMAEYVLTSGTYGTLERKTENEIQIIKNKVHSVFLSRIIYLSKRCFLNYKGMCINYPILKKLPALIPLCWIHRLVFAMLKKRRRIAAELRRMK